MVQGGRRGGVEDAGPEDTREARAGVSGGGEARWRAWGGSPESGFALVVTRGREEHRMGSVVVVAENNGDGQAPGGVARGTPATN